MKKLLVALLALVAMSSLAVAQAPVIGIFDNDDAVQCDGIIEAYVARDIFVFAVLTDIPAITAAEFSISNYVGDLGPACAIVSAAWNTPLVIGDPGFGIALAFSPALPGPNAFLGSINIFLLVIEFVLIFVKPIALMIRLAANMTAGHIILAVMIGFLTTSLSVAAAALVYPAAAFGFFAITVFEIAIAFIQAYIFTALSAVFVGQSLSHDH